MYGFVDEERGKKQSCLNYKRDLDEISSPFWFIDRFVSARKFRRFANLAVVATKEICKWKLMP